MWCSMCCEVLYVKLLRPRPRIEGAKRPLLGTGTSIKSSYFPPRFSKGFRCSFDLFLDTPVEFGDLLLSHSSPSLQTRRPSIANFTATRHPCQQWIFMQPISRSALTRMHTTCIILAEPSPGSLFFFRTNSVGQSKKKGRSARSLHLSMRRLRRILRRRIIGCLQRPR